MTPAEEQGRQELRTHRRAVTGLLAAVALFSVFVNLLMLTGPLFMLQVYDRVLGSRSEETLLALVILMAFLFTIMGVLDFARGRVLARIGARFQAGLDRRVFSAMLKRDAGDPAGTARRGNALRDLEAVQRLMSSPVFTAVFDLPFTPLFLAGILIFHPMLGALALAGGGVLMVVAALNQILTAAPVRNANAAMRAADHVAEHLRAEAEMVQALGMSANAFRRWQTARQKALADTILSSDRAGRFSALSRTFRLFLQSAMLGLGAYLVLRGELTAGAMIAASILLGRALAPVDLAIGQWQLVQRARHGWQGLIQLLSTVPPEARRIALPRPRAHLVVESLTVVPPGLTQPALRGVSFTVMPGEALGVIGPSGAGKSTLARAITGVWRPAAGRIRLDGAALDQFDPDALGQHVGYLPQRVQMFDGTIAENIAGLADPPDDAAVVAAARKAAAHEVILALPDGYNTRISGGGGILSGGQMQRIALARAMYGDPVVLVLDEPNSSLDNDGSIALNTAIRAIKAAGGAVLIMAHRPAAIAECDKLLVLAHGTVKAFGPRDEVLARSVQNAQHLHVARAVGQSGDVT